MGTICKQLTTSDESATTSYTLPAQPPTIPLRPAKPRAPTPENDIEVIEAVDAAAIAGTKRSAPSDQVDLDAEVEAEASKKRKLENGDDLSAPASTKKAKKEVDEVSDDGFEIL
jgi:hypothetical protein